LFKSKSHFFTAKSQSDDFVEFSNSFMSGYTINDGRFTID
jgi:hypothetical protein